MTVVLAILVTTGLATLGYVSIKSLDVFDGENCARFERLAIDQPVLRLRLRA
jgi:hypothetical protein